MITYDNVKISSVKVDDSYYDHKKKTHINYTKPKTTKKVLFEDSCLDIGELYLQIKNCHDREPYNKIEVSFESKMEY